MRRNTDEINECADILDSRDIEGRIDELESLIECHESDIEKHNERIGEIMEESAELNEKLSEMINGERADQIDETQADLDELEDEMADLADRIKEAKEELEPLVEEHKELTDFRDEVGSREWRHGLQLIADSYFEEYARQFAEDMGLMENCDKWPATCIDWERAASELEHDFSSAELRGHTFYFRD